MTETRVTEKAVLGSVRLDSDVWEAVRAMPVSLNVYLRRTLLSGDSPFSELLSHEVVPTPKPGVDYKELVARAFEKRSKR